MHQPRFRLIGVLSILAFAFFAACAPAAPSPTAVPARPAESKPAAPPTAVPAKPAAAAPTTAPTKPTEPAKPAATAASVPTTAPAPKPAATVKPLPVRYGMLSVNAQHWVVIAGNEAGIFRKNGVELDVIMIAGGPAALQALVGGSVDMTLATVDGAVPLQQKTPDMKQILAISQTDGHALIGGPDIKKPEDLKGKTLGASAVKTNDAFYIRSQLYDYGLRDERDYSIIVSGTGPARTAALQNGQIKAVSIFEPEISQLMDRGFTNLGWLATGPGKDLFGSFQNLVVVSMKPWYTAHPEETTRFVKAWIESSKWLYDPANKQQAIDILAKALNNIDRKYAEKTYKSYVEDIKLYSPDGRLDPAKIQNVFKSMERLGDLKPPLPDPREYIDMAPFERAQVRP